jgi:hypothetical protein
MPVLILIRYEQSSGKWYRVSPKRFASESKAEWWLKERIYEGELDAGEYYVAPLIFQDELKKRLLNGSKDNGSKG